MDLCFLDNSGWHLWKSPMPVSCKCSSPLLAPLVPRDSNGELFTASSRSAPGWEGGMGRGWEILVQNGGPPYHGALCGRTSYTTIPPSQAGHSLQLLSLTAHRLDIPKLGLKPLLHIGRLALLGLGWNVIPLRESKNGKIIVSVRIWLRSVRVIFIFIFSNQGSVILLWDWLYYECNTNCLPFCVCFLVWPSSPHNLLAALGMMFVWCAEPIWASLLWK